MDLPDAAALESTRFNKKLPSSVQSFSSKWRAASLAGETAPRPARKRKRKSRAKPKVPVTQLSATKFNFKDLVHQFTGNHDLPLPSANICKPASPPALPSASCSDTPVADVNAQAANHAAIMLAELAHGLRLLYTLCAPLLQHGASTKGLPWSEERVRNAEARANSSSEAKGGHALGMASPNVSSSDSCPFSPPLHRPETICRELGGASAAHMLDHVDVLSTAQELEGFLLSADCSY